MEVDLGPGHFVVDGSQLFAKRHSSPPPLRPMPIVATVAPSQLTAELLSLLFIHLILSQA